MPWISREMRRERGNSEREFEANNGSSRGSDRTRVENQAGPTDFDLEANTNTGLR